MHDSVPAYLDKRKPANRPMFMYPIAGPHKSMPQLQHAVGYAWSLLACIHDAVSLMGRVL
jgi:hypothetical protein